MGARLWFVAVLLGGMTSCNVDEIDLSGKHCSACTAQCSGTTAILCDPAAGNPCPSGTCQSSQISNLSGYHQCK